MPGVAFSYLTPGTSTAVIRSLFKLVDEFTRSHHHLDVQIQNIPWPDAWQQLMRMAIYKKGPDLSEIGAPWTSDFVGMNSLRPFQPAELARLGGQANFAPVAWQNCQVHGDAQAWGIPARVDVRVIFYWKDMVEQAGIDPQVGFSTPEHFAESMARLRAAGFERPLTMVTDNPRNNVYLSASWIWGMGGELVDGEGQVAFHQPKAQCGLIHYFNLHPYLAFSDQHPDQVFLSRQAAVIMAGPWVVGQIRRHDFNPGQTAPDPRIGTALPPGPTFVGGTNLVIWSHTGHHTAQLALDLIDFLLKAPGYLPLCLETDTLPATLPALNSSSIAGDPNYAVMAEALRRGRTHASTHLWVLLAERLGTGLAHLWASLRQNPSQDVAGEVARLTESVQARLRLSIP